MWMYLNIQRVLIISLQHAAGHVSSVFVPDCEDWKGLELFTTPPLTRAEKPTGELFYRGQANYIIVALYRFQHPRKEFLPNWGWRGVFTKRAPCRRSSQSHELHSPPPTSPKSSRQLATIKGRSCGDLTCSQSLHLQGSWGGIIHSKSSRTP